MSSEGFVVPPHDVEHSHAPATESGAHDQHAEHGHIHNGSCCGAEAMHSPAEADVLSANLALSREQSDSGLSGSSLERQSIGSCEDGSCGHMHHHEADAMSDELFSAFKSDTSTIKMQSNESTNQAAAEHHHSHGAAEASATAAFGKEASSEAPVTVEQTAEATSVTKAAPEQAGANQEVLDTSSATGSGEEHSPGIETTIDNSPPKTEVSSANQETSSSGTSSDGKEQSMAQAKPASELPQSAPARTEAVVPTSESAASSPSSSTGPEVRPADTATGESVKTTNSKLDRETTPTKANAKSTPAAPIETNQTEVPAAAKIEQSSQVAEVADSPLSETIENPAEVITAPAETNLADAQAKEMLLDDIELATVAPELMQSEAEAAEAYNFEEYSLEDAATDFLEDEGAAIDTRIEEMPADSLEQTNLSSEPTKSETGTTEASSGELHTAQDIEAIFAEAEAITAATEINDAAEQADKATAGQQMEAATTPEEEVFDIEQIMSNIEQLYAEEAATSSESVTDSGVDTEEIKDSISPTPVKEILGSSAGAESRPKDQLPKIMSEALPGSNAEVVTTPELDQRADAIAREIYSKLEIHRSQNQINAKTVLPLLEKYNLNLNDQQLEKLLALLRSDSDEQTAEFITGLLKLRHIEYQQEFLKSSKQSFAKQLTQKHHRLLGALRKLFPSLLVNPEN